MSEVREELCGVDGLAEAEQRDGGGEADVPPTRNARWGKCTRNSKGHSKELARHDSTNSSEQSREQEVTCDSCDGGSLGTHTRKRDDDVGVQEYSPKVMHGNIIEFRPRGWKGQQVHGVFLVDSFYYMKDESRGWEQYVEYLPDLLQSLWERTGYVFTAYCCGGAALVKPMGSGARFADMLSLVPYGLEVILPIVCGNDFLGGGGWYVHKYDLELDKAVEELCVEMKAKSRRQFAVGGGSSSTWNYSHPEDVNRRYDDNADRLVAAFEACGVRACTGAHELVGMKIVDKIRHVGFQSYNVVEAAFFRWFDFATQEQRTDFEATASDTCGSGGGMTIAGECGDDACDEKQEEDAREIAGAQAEAEVVRKYGFVALERGEFEHLRGTLSANACVSEPGEFEQTLLEDGWWQGLPWLGVAKALHVTQRLLMENGWNVPSFVVQPLVEAAMQQHEAGARPCKASVDLHEILFCEAAWVKKKLMKCKRLHCVSCATSCELECFRLPLDPNLESKGLKHVFCKVCYWEELKKMTEGDTSMNGFDESNDEKTQIAEWADILSSFEFAGQEVHALVSDESGSEEDSGRHSDAYSDCCAAADAYSDKSMLDVSDGDYLGDIDGNGDVEEGVRRAYVQGTCSAPAAFSLPAPAPPRDVPVG